MRVPLTWARALALSALAFGVLGALGIAPGSAGAEEPPVPPPPDYEYDVLPGSISDRPGLTAIELVGALERGELKVGVNRRDRPRRLVPQRRARARGAPAPQGG